MSLARRLYYDLKPVLPAWFRIAVRRRRAAKVLRKASNWPIDVSASQPPANWLGWPPPKQFAFVLTHDVEGLSGLVNCRPLMELEQEFGVRSSFNFVPEGEYSTPPELRAELVTNGFEVGVHDLRHDGKLYRSEKEFLRAAERINKYLREWNAVGFRSGFMHHKLEWLHALDIAYDMSTFDIDPFEPQPDGVHTIFPFWVGCNPRARNSGKEGYCELPYTLPQDFTIFTILREKTIDIWKRKLDWIAVNGGMALLNVHPDYISFSRETRQGQTRNQMGRRRKRKSLNHSNACGVCQNSSITRFGSEESW